MCVLCGVARFEIPKWVMRTTQRGERCVTLNVLSLGFLALPMLAARVSAFASLSFRVCSFYYSSRPCDTFAPQNSLQAAQLLAVVAFSTLLPFLPVHFEDLLPHINQIHSLLELKSASPLTFVFSKKLYPAALSPAIPSKISCFSSSSQNTTRHLVIFPFATAPATNLGPPTISIHP